MKRDRQEQHVDQQWSNGGAQQEGTEPLIVLIKEGVIIERLTVVLAGVSARQGDNPT